MYFEITFDFSGYGRLKTICNDGEISFDLEDVCRALELQAAAVMRRLDEGMTVNHPLQTAGGIQQVNFVNEDGIVSKYPIVDALGRTQQANFVNEDGLYEIAFNNRNPKTYEYYGWICLDVIPKIRYHQQNMLKPLE